MINEVNVREAKVKETTIISSKIKNAKVQETTVEDFKIKEVEVEGEEGDGVQVRG